MVIANSTGWEILTPFEFQATWDGRSLVDGITIESDRSPERVRRSVCSHFGHGILTFHPGYVFRTSPGWAVWARGTPNRYKDGITPLEGLIETEWLPFSFTMNWRFTRPCTIRFRAGEPFCFLTLAPHGAIDGVVPRMTELSDDQAAFDGHQDWLTSRRAFNAGRGDPTSDKSKHGWQRRYLTGDGAPGDAHHVTKRRLHSPQPRSDNGVDQ